MDDLLPRVLRLLSIRWESPGLWRQVGSPRRSGDGHGEPNDLHLPWGDSLLVERVVERPVILQPARMPEVALELRRRDDAGQAALPRRVIGDPAASRINGKTLRSIFKFQVKAGSGRSDDPDDGTVGAGVTVPLKPPPPVSVGKEAKTIPTGNDDDSRSDLAA